jgi:hypothetical protein
MSAQVIRKSPLSMQVCVPADWTDQQVIGGVCIGPGPDDLKLKGPIVRHVMNQFETLNSNEPFFIIQGKFELFAADSALPSHKREGE